MSINRVRLYNMDEFREAVKNHKDSDVSLETLLGAESEAGLIKSHTPVISKMPDEEFGLSFTISDEGVDRDRDTIRVAGWNLKNYKKNPVVLWAHISGQPPIARSVVRVDNGLLVADAVFTPRDLYPFGHMIFQMYDQGFLNATSVGFKPEKWEYIDETAADETRRGGVNFLKQELLEWSAVPIPANPRALMRAHEVGIDLAPLTQWCCEYLDLDPKTVKVAARQEIEAVWKKLASHPVYVEVKEAEVEVKDPEPLLTPEEEALIRVMALTISWEDESVELLYQTLTQKLLALCKTQSGEHDLALKKKLGMDMVKRFVAESPTDDELEDIEFEEDDIESLDFEDEDVALSIEDKKRIASEIMRERIAEILGGQQAADRGNSDGKEE